MIIGDTPLAKKKCLAKLVAQDLIEKGHKATIIENRVNSKGHTDRVLVDSSIGLVHVVASRNDDPNGSILTSDIDDGDQSFLMDKDFVAYGWNTKDKKKTIVKFVPVSFVLGKKSLSKDQIRDASNRDYNFSLPKMA